MDFKSSQQDMKNAYLGGATGVLVSGAVWLIAGFIGIKWSDVAAMYALFIGGMFIFPFAILLSKLLSASGKHALDNCLTHLALETLPVLFGGLIIAFYVAQIEITLFFPIMLLAIGARYFAFQTLYALKTYWVLGAMLMIAGVICTIFRLPFLAGAFAGGILEIVFAVWIFHRSRRKLATKSKTIVHHD